MDGGQMEDILTLKDKAIADREEALKALQKQMTQSLKEGSL